MKKFAIVLLATMLVAGIAIAQKPALEKPVVPYTPNSRAVEVEPNDDYMTANALVIGDDMSAAIDPAGDVDFYSITVTAGSSLSFETMPGDVGDTKMYLFDVDGMTELAYNDDIGYPNYYSRIEYDFTVDGTYFVEVTGYGASTLGTYILTVGEAEPPCPTPENDTCEGALALPMGTTFTTTNCGAANDYSPTNGCTGWDANGLDIVYYVDLVENQQFTVSVDGTWDMSIYLLTDCADMESCVAGSDGGNPENFVFDAADAPGRYYLILDGYSSAGVEGDFEVTVDGVVATDATSFGTLKSMYR